MSEYLKYVLTNIEPLRIADDSTSQNGQTVSLRYIPGTSVRGMVVNSIKRSNEDKFEELKRVLLSDKVRFLNAYISYNDRELVPSPKGFYEDKTTVGSDQKKRIENVVIKGDFSDGLKRASLGKFCYFDEDCVHYYNVDTSSDMKIKFNLENENEKQNVFRNEYVCAGYTFIGFIAIDNPEIKPYIEQAFKNQIIIGNARSSGLGKCNVEKTEYLAAGQLPYELYVSDKDESESSYLMLLSHTVMRDSTGKLCGIDTEKLAAELGVANMQISYCSTSTVNVRGYNRTIGNKLPSMNMYEQGSVFHITYTGTITAQAKRKVMNDGVGVRRNEGFGRILFLSNYENIVYKKPEEYEKRNIQETAGVEDIETLRIVAREYYRRCLKKEMLKYIVDHPLDKGSVSKSRLGEVQARLSKNRYNYEDAKKELDVFMDHHLKRENDAKIFKEQGSMSKLNEFITEVFKEDYLERFVSTGLGDTIMGIDKSKLISKEEIGIMKLQFLCDMLRYDRKG